MGRQLLSSQGRLVDNLKVKSKPDQSRRGMEGYQSGYQKDAPVKRAVPMKPKTSTY